jgi:Na+/H+ antiporter NhaD/arsenite permease-like protein
MEIVALAVLAVTYAGIVFARLPRVNIDRPSAAFGGAVLMVLLGVLTVDEAIAVIDFDTIALLLGMMVIVAALQRDGFFTLLAEKSLALASTPRRLLAVTVVSTAVASAFLVNDAVVLLFTPVVIAACRSLRVNPVPYLVGEAMASNVGSTATMVGNPQNMIIGIASGLSFGRFSLHLAPVAAVATLTLLAVLLWAHRRELAAETTGRTATGLVAPSGAAGYDLRAMRGSVAVLGLTIIGFFASPFIGLTVPMVALAMAALALIVSRARPADVIRDVDWVLLLFFAGLFVVIGGAHQAGVLDPLLEGVDLTPGLPSILSLHVVSAAVSQVVSNVPLSILMVPIIEQAPSPALWLSLASGATLGGNMTIIGAVANIIVAERAAREGVTLPWAAFAKVGVAVTALTLAEGVAILWAQQAMGWLG